MQWTAGLKPRSCFESLSSLSLQVPSGRNTCQDGIGRSLDFLFLQKKCADSRYSRYSMSGVNRPGELNSLIPIAIVVSFLVDCAKWTNDCVNLMRSVLNAVSVSVKPLRIPNNCSA